WLCHRAAGANSDDRHPGGRHRRRLDRARGHGRAACGTGKRGCPAGPRVLRARRRRADYHRRQSHPRTAGRRSISWRRGQARYRRRQACARSADRQAARTRFRCGRRRHSAHRHHKNVSHGALGTAYGMLVAELRRDFVKTWFTPLADASFAVMEETYVEMERRGREAVQGSEVAVAGVVGQRAAGMRYVGQEHAVTVELPLELFAAEDRDGIKTRFDSVHATRYGYSAPGEKAEVVSLRSAVTGVLRKPTFEPIAAGTATPPETAFRGTRAVYFAEVDRSAGTPTYDRTSLLAENRIAGPALIEEYASTTVVHPGDVVTVDAFGDLVIEILRS